MENKQMSIEEIRECIIGILNYVDNLCRKEGLTYYLAGGTLLGAVRHKGFIPWDDDIDIMMPRKDFEKLLDVFPTGGTYVFMTIHNTQHFPYAFGKIVDNRTLKKEPLRPLYQVIGVDIDVFPIDKYPDDINEAKVWCASIRKLQKSMLSLCAPFAKGESIIRTIAGNTIRALKHVLDDLGIITVRSKAIKINVLSQQYNLKDTSYCGIAAIAAYGERKRNRQEVFSDTVELEFEGKKYCAPIGYKEYLTDYYGDFMQLPPVDKRKTHHTYRAYWK